MNLHRAQEEDTTFAVALQGSRGKGLFKRHQDQEIIYMRVILVQVSTIPRVHVYCSTGSLVFLHRNNCSPFPRADQQPLNNPRVPEADNTLRT